MAIFDCFTFFNEYDVLEMRLDILNQYVDYFVLVESTKNHHGEDKPLYFARNRERYHKYKEKIICVCVEDAPEYQGEADMGIENFLRNAIMRGLVGNACPDDYIMVSDVDEIPNPHILQNLHNIKIGLYTNRGSWKQKLRQHLRVWSMFSQDFMRIGRENKGYPVDELLNYTPIGLEYDFFYYFMNCKNKEWWRGPYIAKFKHMMMPHDPRELSYQSMLPVIRNAGWHFSYLGGLESVKAKLAALSDPNPEIERHINRAKNDDEYIIKCLENGIDVLGRKGHQFEFEFINPYKLTIPNLDELMKRFPQFFH